MNFEAHPSLGAGMVRDVQRHLLDGAFYDAVNMIVDVDGKVRKRGGTTSISNGQDMQYNAPQWMLAFASGDFEDVRVLYALQEYPYVGALNYGLNILPQNSTPRLGPIATLGRQLGRPFRFGRYCCFPQFTTNTSQLPAQIYHGTWATSWTTFSANALTALGGSVTNGSNIVTFNAGDRPGLGYGDWLTIPSSPAGTTYSSVITALNTSTTTCLMDHPCGFTDASVDIDLSYIGPGSNTIYGSIVGSKCGAAFQNRIVYGDVLVRDGTTYIHATNGLAWSSLPTETVTFGSVTYSGFHQHVVVAPNFLRVPDVTRIVGLAPVGPSQLLILAPERCVRLAGNLATISADNQSLPVDLQPISTTVGCLSDRSIQETSYGVVWAAADGVYIYDGTELRNLMQGRLVTFWDKLQDDSTFQIQGSAVVRGDHYILSTTVGCLMLNIPLGAWTRLNDDFNLSCATSDPAEPTVTYAGRWRSPSSSADDNTIGQTIYRLDTILDPTAANPADHNGRNVECSLESQAYVMGDPARLKRLRRATVVADVKNHTNLATFNPGVELEVHLPNGDAEEPSATARWWRPTATSTVTQDSAQAHGGRYSIKAVTSAINSGVIYDLPAGYFDAGTIWSVEVWVYNTTAGTVTLTHNGSTATTTAVNTWTRLVVSTRVAASTNVINLTAQITHSVAVSTFYVDDLRLFDLRPFQRTASTVTLAANTTDKHTGTASLEITAPATLGTGAYYYLPMASLTAAGHTINTSWTASVWLKSTAGATDWTITINDASANATSSNVTVTSAWKPYTVTHTTTSWNTSGQFINVQIGRTSAATATVLVDDIAIVNNETPVVDVAAIGGLEAEGDYGDGTADDATFANFSRDYRVNGNWGLSGTELAPTTSGGSAIIYYQRGNMLTRDGEAVAKFTYGHANDRLGLLLTGSTDTDYLMAETRGGGVSSIRKSVSGVITSLLAGTAATITLGVPYWIRFVRIGNFLRVEHYEGDPALGYDPITANTVEHQLSTADAATFNVVGRMGLRPVAGDTTMRIQAFRCQPYDSMGQYAADASGPGTTRRAAAILTRGATFRYRSRGASGECELGGLNFEYQNLRAGRIS